MKEKNKQELLDNIVSQIDEKKKELQDLEEQAKLINNGMDNSRYVNMKNFALDFIDFLAEHKDDGYLFSNHRRHVGETIEMYGQPVLYNYEEGVYDPNKGGFPTFNILSIYTKDFSDCGYETYNPIDAPGSKEKDERVVVSFAVDRDKLTDLLEKHNLNTHD